MMFPHLAPAVPKKLRGMRPQVRRAWDTVAPKLLATGNLTALDGMALWLLCTSWCDYLAALEQANNATDDERRRLHEKTAVLFHGWAREWAAEMLMIPAERVPVCPLNDEGIDAELAEWFRGGLSTRRST